MRPEWRSQVNRLLHGTTTLRIPGPRASESNQPPRKEHSDHAPPISLRAQTGRVADVSIVSCFFACDVLAHRCQHPLVDLTLHRLRPWTKSD